MRHACKRDLIFNALYFTQYFYDEMRSGEKEGAGLRKLMGCSLREKISESKMSTGLGEQNIFRENVTFTKSTFARTYKIGQYVHICELRSGQCLAVGYNSVQPVSAWVEESVSLIRQFSYCGVTSNPTFPNALRQDGKVVKTGIFLSVHIPPQAENTTNMQV